MVKFQFMNTDFTDEMDFYQICVKEKNTKYQS